MNILTDALPDAVEIDGRKYAVNSDFRSCLRIMLAFEDQDLTPQEKHLVMLSNLYREIPPDARDAMTGARWFPNCGKDDQEGNNQPRVFSWSHDAELIYAAFRQTHGIDLQTADLHWWKFIALFMDLGQNTAFCSLSALRKRVKTGKASKEERAAAREMGEIFEVPEIDTRTLAEKEAEAEFIRLVGA